MAKSKKKIDSKTYAHQKRTRRQWITFMRMLRYGINNFSRNAWLTVAATAVMTITLFVIFSAVTARNILVDTISDIRDNVGMSIYVGTETTPENASIIGDDLRKLSSVLDVSYTTPEQARKDYIEQNKQDAATLEAVKESTNRFPGTFNIKVKDINDTSQLAEFVKTNEPLKANIDPTHSPSFAGDSRATIEKIAQAVDFAQKIGVGASLVFVAMSMLIIFNTIRMAIFNRREEIQMMKLIGAEKSFIRGPFVVEAMVYGFIAAIIASALGYAAVFTIAPALIDADINVQPTVDLLTVYIGFVLLAMIVIGAIIGVISSLMATRRYLRL